MELNQNVYLKSKDYYKVATPTTAMEKGGTEIRLFITVISILICCLSPFILLISNFRSGYLQEDINRQIFAILSLFLLVLPLYFTTRYHYGLFHAILMTCRGIFTPIFMSLSLSEEYQQGALIVSILFSISLFTFRKLCEPTSNNNNNKLRILIIGDALPPKVDGVATFAQHSVIHLQQLGHTLHLVTSIAGPDNLWGAPVTRLPGMTTPISPGHSITLPLPSVLLIMLKFKPHVIHLFEVSPLNLATFVYAQIANIPVTFSHHTRLDLYINIVTPLFPLWLNAAILYTLERVFYPLVDGHLCVSKVLFEKVKRRGTSEVRFWSSGVDFNFDKNKYDAHTKVLLSGGDVHLPLVVHVGRLGPEKNSDEIPAIMKETWKLMKGRVRFCIVGDGILRPQIEEEIKKNGIRCVFVGFKRGLELEQCYASCDVFFSPSTTEGFPLVFLEAMASGLAVVGPIAGGVPDGYQEGVQGCLFEPHNPKSGAEAIQRAIQGGDIMRAKAYEQGRKYSWDNSVGELDSLLKLVVKKKQMSGWRRWWLDSKNE